MRIRDLYQSAVDRLRYSGIESAELEAALLLGHVLGTDRSRLSFVADQVIREKQETDFENVLGRRLRREPLAYIIGECEFWSRQFIVNKAVLIPRPETEFLLEKVIEIAVQPGDIPQKLVLDLGVGSGVIAIVLALEMAESYNIYGIDYSEAALRVAQINARRNQVAERIHFVNSDLFSAIRNGEQFGLIVSNPPYVECELLAKGKDAGGLQPEVVGYEPHLALNGGINGVEFMDKIADSLAGILHPGGWFFMEIGANQAKYVCDRFTRTGYFERMLVHNDYAGLPRVFQARKLSGRGA
jgi:release factor glutamine methyltransferase